MSPVPDSSALETVPLDLSWQCGIPAQSGTPDMPNTFTTSPFDLSSQGVQAKEEERHAVARHGVVLPLRSSDGLSTDTTQPPLAMRTSATVPAHSLAAQSRDSDSLVIAAAATAVDRNAPPTTTSLSTMAEPNLRSTDPLDTPALTRATSATPSDNNPFNLLVTPSLSMTTPDLDPSVKLEPTNVNVDAGAGAATRRPSMTGAGPSGSGRAEGEVRGGTGAQEGQGKGRAIHEDEDDIMWLPNPEDVGKRRSGRDKARPARKQIMDTAGSDKGNNAGSTGRKRKSKGNGRVVSVKQEAEISVKREPGTSEQDDDPRVLERGNKKARAAVRPRAPFIDPRAATTATNVPLPTGAGCRSDPSASSSSRGRGSQSKRPKPQPIAVFTPHGYGRSIDVPYDESFVYLYFRFCAERHRMWVKRSQGVPRVDQTKDECMRSTFVGNVFRELDPGGERDRRLCVDRGEMSNEELCFRFFLFTGFYLESTYEALVKGLGEVPSWKKFNLEQYEAILYEHYKVRGNKIYYGGFQMVSPTFLFGGGGNKGKSPAGEGQFLPPYSGTLRLIKSMMEMGLPARLLECKYAVDASEYIQTIPTLGPFLSLCLLCFLQEAPTLKFYIRDFATCGPGSRGFLQRIFGEHVINNTAMEQAGLKWLYENQWRYWARLGEDPPHAHELGLRPGMRVLDIENALCWCHRYTNDSVKYRSLADLPAPTFDKEVDENAQPPAWCDEERNVASYSRPVYAGDYEEEKAKLGKLEKAELAELKISTTVKLAAKTGAKSKGKEKVKLEIFVEDKFPAEYDQEVPSAGVAAETTPVPTGSTAEEGEEEEEYWEIEKIVGRLGARTKKNGKFRVRWKGYPPEDDTWEPEADIRLTASDALNDWLEWENGVSAAIEKVKREDVYRGPIWVEKAQQSKSKGKRTNDGRGQRGTGMSVKEEIILDEEDGANPLLIDAALTATLGRNGAEVVQPGVGGSGSGRPTRTLQRPERLLDSLTQSEPSVPKRLKTDVTKEEVDMKVPVA